MGNRYGYDVLIHAAKYNLQKILAIFNRESIAMSKNASIINVIRIPAIDIAAKESHILQVQILHTWLSFIKTL
jgi:hypothetical protein